MKRVLSVLLAAVLCVGMLTGCGNTNSGSKEKEEQDAVENRKMLARMCMI